MKRIISILIIALAFCWSTPAYAQQTRVSGKVTDFLEDPLMGVVVMEKGTSNGTTTDSQGSFSLNVAGNSSVLVFKLMGFLEDEIEVGTKTNISVKLSEEALNIEELVIVGYGTQKKASVVGAISSASGSDLQRSAASNLTQTVGGRVAGVFSRSPGGRPGEDNAHLFIRGLATFNTGGNSPLTIVDGIEREIGQIDPEDIEAFTVLKDASATAVYGVRGANGVIIITTKRGQTAKPEVEFRSTFTGSSPMRLPKKLGSYDYARLKNEALANVGEDSEYTTYDLDMYRTGSGQFTHPDNDYMDDFLKDMAFKQQYNLVVRGGTPFVRYYASANFLNDDGIFKPVENDLYNPNINYKRYGLRSNLDFNVTKTTVVGIDVSGRLEERHNNGFASNDDGNRLYGLMLRMPPNYLNYKNPDGSYGGGVGGSDLINPYAALSRWGYQHAKRNVFEVVARLNQDLDFIVEGLSARAMFSYVTAMKSRRDLVENPNLMSYSKYGDYGVSLAEKFISIDVSSGNQGPYTRQITSELGFDYKLKKNKHSLTALALVNQYQSYTYTHSTANLPKTYINYVGRVTYDYDNRYLAEFNAGVNGSMNFAKGNRFGTFPAFSAGWVASNEKFWNQNSKIFNYLKVRGSLGQVGNDQYGNYKTFYESLYLQFTSDRPTFGETQSVMNRVLEAKLGNKQVSWERSTKGNVGFDSKFFNGRLALTADFFYENRTSILDVDRNIQTIIGMLDANNSTKGFAPENMGRVINRGFEFDLGWNDKVGDIRYYVKGNFSFARNKILEDGQAPQTYEETKTMGKKIGQRFGLIADGFYSSYDEITALPSGFTSNLKLGDIKYRDVNNDGRTDEYDIVDIGHTLVPEIIYGVTVGGDWKNFDLQIFWQGATNSDIYANGFGYWEFTNNSSVLAHHLDRWTPETAATATYPSLSPATSEQNHRLSTFWLQDATYLRLKNLQLGYTIPKQITKKARISNLRFYVGGTNLITISSFKVYDPESSDGAGGGYPNMRQFTAGASIRF